MEEFTRESQIEDYLVREVAKLGGKAYKFSSMSNRAVPDRLCIFPSGHIYFIECKAPGKTWSALQWRVAKFLRKLGCNVALADTKGQVNFLLSMIKEEING